MKKPGLLRWVSWLVLVLTLAGPAGLALAHANLVRSDPVAGAVLAQAPTMITLEFSEDLDLRFSNVHLTDGSAQVVVNGPGTTDPAAPRLLRLPLPSLSNGVYSAVWQARSAADGHLTTGSVGFSVGAAAPRASLLPPPGTPEPATALPPLADTVVRWLSFLAVSIGLGSLFFGPLVWRPAYATWLGKDPAADEQATRLLRRLAQWGNAGLIVMTLVFLGYQAAQLAGANLWQALSGLLVGRMGLILEARLVLLVVLLLAVPRLPAAGGGPLSPWGAVAVLGGGVLLTFSLISHAVLLYPPTGLLLDWLHLVAMSAWIGGLLPLLLLLRQREGMPLSVLVPRFSMVALPSVAIMALTGLTSGLFHVMTPEALLTTSYGWILLIKISLFGLLFVMGAVNLLVLSPRLQASTAAGWLRQTVRSEMTIGLLVILGAGIMTDAAPAFDAMQMQQEMGVMQTIHSGAVKMVVRIAPGKTGDNELAVDLSDRRSGIDPTQNTVLLRLRMMDSATNMGATQVETVTQDHVRYSARGSYLSMMGHWQVQIIVRQAGVNDVVCTCLVMIPDAAPMAGRANDQTLLAGDWVPLKVVEP
jgi:copper transport protein